MIRKQFGRLEFSTVIFALGLITSCMPFVSPLIALLIGILIAQLVGDVFNEVTHKASAVLLQVSVVGLGFGMNAQNVIAAGREGFLFTFISIGLTLFLGILAGRAFGVERKTSHLISCGTAICGGSAIAAVSPVVQAGQSQSSVALGTIFILNAAALLIFPSVGTVLHLSQHQFGLWAAIAIHDTSSVVAAASAYGNEALQIATTVKLARALWIIPVALVTAVVFKSVDRRVKVPWFIGLFVIAICMNTYVPLVAGAAPYILNAAKMGLTVTLFLIGTGMSRTAIRSVGWMPLLQGALIWVIISVASLVVILKLLV